MLGKRRGNDERGEARQIFSRLGSLRSSSSALCSFPYPLYQLTYTPTLDVCAMLRVLGEERSRTSAPKKGLITQQVVTHHNGCLAVYRLLEEITSLPVDTNQRREKVKFHFV